MISVIATGCALRAPHVARVSSKAKSSKVRTSQYVRVRSLAQLRRTTVHPPLQSQRKNHCHILYAAAHAHPLVNGPGCSLRRGVVTRAAEAGVGSFAATKRLKVELPALVLIVDASRHEEVVEQ
eukprot:7381997-Pyramimonas_sp.AAC.1